MLGISSCNELHALQETFVGLGLGLAQAQEEITSLPWSRTREMVPMRDVGRSGLWSAYTSSAPLSPKWVLHSSYVDYTCVLEHQQCQGHVPLQMTASWAKDFWLQCSIDGPTNLGIQV